MRTVYGIFYRNAKPIFFTDKAAAEHALEEGKLLSDGEVFMIEFKEWREA